jgi:hypothetical protein
MYSALWRILPGPRWLKAIQMAALAAVTVFILFEWVFPWVAETFLTEPSTVDSKAMISDFRVN